MIGQMNARLISILIGVTDNFVTLYFFMCLFQISVPIDVFPGSHIRFEFSHCSGEY